MEEKKLLENEVSSEAPTPTQSDETLFENTYTQTEQYYKEILFYQLFSRKAYIGLNILAGVLIVSDIILAIWLRNPSDLVSRSSIFLYIAIVCMNLSVILRYRKENKLWIQRCKEISDSEREVTYLLAEDNGLKITALSSNGAKNESQNLKIKKVYQTKNFFLLLSEAKLLYIFKKGAFTKGSDDEFREYLRSKGFKVK